jgi:hypothetical protein
LTVLFGVLIGASVLLGLWFVLALGAPWRSESPTMAWLQAAIAWVAVAFDVALLLALLRIHVPAWGFVLILLAQDVVFGWRLALLWRARRAAGVANYERKGS